MIDDGEWAGVPIGGTASFVNSDGAARTAFDLVAGRLRERLLQRAPGLDPLDLELTLILLSNGLAAIAQHWIHAHPDLRVEIPADTRADWDRLLDRLLLRLRVGHAG